MSLKINEIFYSIQGESSFAGQACVFVRLSGCNLRCPWCDTVYAYNEGEILETEEILEKVMRFEGCKLVEITGGEPMMQNEVPDLARRFMEKGYTVLLETNGSYPLSLIPPEVHKIVDFKTPAAHNSENYEKIWETNLPYIGKNDEVKAVVARREEFDYCIERLKDFEILGRVTTHFSAAFGLLEPKDLVEWILESRLPIRLNLQWHKYIWNPETRGV